MKKQKYDKERNTKKLKNNRWVKVYHQIDDCGNHYYFFIDGGKAIYLDWGCNRSYSQPWR